MGNTIVKTRGDDQVVETGSELIQGTTWSWRKWKSGKIECEGTIDWQIDTWTKWNSSSIIYWSNFSTYGPSSEPRHIPAIFSSKPSIRASGWITPNSPSYNSCDTWLGMRNWAWDSSNPYIPSFYFARSDNMTYDFIGYVDVYLTNE